MANNITSPWQTYPGLANTVRGYVKKYAGFSSRFEREPLSPQDVEHLIGTCGIDTPQKQQSKYIWDSVIYCVQDTDERKVTCQFISFV